MRFLLINSPARDKRQRNTIFTKLNGMPTSIVAKAKQ